MLHANFPRHSLHRSRCTCVVGQRFTCLLKPYIQPQLNFPLPSTSTNASKVASIFGTGRPISEANSNKNAVERVLNITELTESIILAPRPSDILLAAYANKTWRSIICKSTSLLNRLKSSRYDSTTRDPTTLEANFASSFVHCEFRWGTIFIRRLHSVAIVGILLPPSRGRTRARTKQRLVFLDSERIILGAVRMSSTCWRVKFQDVENF